VHERTHAERSGVGRNAAWLLSPREDLLGGAPRDVMLDDRHHPIGTDREAEQRQFEEWSREFNERWASNPEPDGEVPF